MSQLLGQASALHTGKLRSDGMHLPCGRADGSQFAHDIASTQRDSLQQLLHHAYNAPQTVKVRACVGCHCY